ncbi:MAG: hypothetical protein GDA54_00865 [Alphaproteobacteria bacterium GM7ARS4]|nr:hypothetical protein [Alphaproteobacteria bacterium GM7ARS4]
MGLAVTPPFFVVGGLYRDTSWRALASDTKEQRHGPFDTWQEAHAVWAQTSWAHVDSCLTRYTIRDSRDHILIDAHTRSNP